MFGAIVAGRLVQTNLQQIDDTHFLFPLEQPYEINHLTVFLLGTGTATLGIEIAPAAQLEALLTELGGGEDGKVRGKELVAKVEVGKVAEKVVKNLFNYLHSFGGEVKLTPETPIPLSIFQQWYTNFLRKIENDKGAGFLDREV